MKLMTWVRLRATKLSEVLPTAPGGRSVSTSIVIHRVRTRGSEAATRGNRANFLNQVLAHRHDRFRHFLAPDEQHGRLHRAAAPVSVKPQ